MELFIDVIVQNAMLRTGRVKTIKKILKKNPKLHAKTLESLKWLKEKVFETAEDEPNVPHCDKCGGVVRPDIVFFGESLPNRYFQNIKSDFQECDLLLVLGTSLTVMPFANLITESKSNVPRVYINLSKPGSAGLLGKIMGLGKFLNQDVDFKGGGSNKRSSRSG